VVGLGANLVACALDAGIQPPIAAFAYSCVNGVTLASIIIVGLIAERFNHRAMITIAYAMPAIGILFLFNLYDSAPLFFFATIAGIAGAARITLWPLVVHDTFGKRTYATIMGLLIIFYTAGIALAPPVTGFLYDTTGGYSAILVTTMTAFFLSGVFIAVGTADLKKKTGDIIPIFSNNHLK
jgi:MFS family permease